jgi:hypothetical protein
MIDYGLALEVGVYGLMLVGCGYILGRDKGVKHGASTCIDTLIANGYLKATEHPNGEIEIHKLVK